MMAKKKAKKKATTAKKKAKKQLQRDIVLDLWSTWAGTQCMQGGESPGEAASTFIEMLQVLGINLPKKFNIDQEELTLETLKWFT